MNTVYTGEGEESIEYIDDRDYTSSYATLSATLSRNTDELYITTQQTAQSIQSCISRVKGIFTDKLTGITATNFIPKLIEQGTSTTKQIAELVIWGYQHGVSKLVYTFLEQCGISYSTLDDFINNAILPAHIQNIFNTIKSVVTTIISVIDKVLSTIKWAISSISSFVDTNIDSIATITEFMVSIGGGLACGLITSTGIGIALGVLCGIGVAFVSSALKELIPFVNCLARGRDDCEFNWNKVAEAVINDIIITALSFGIGKLIAPVFRRVKINGVSKIFKFGGKTAAEIVENHKILSKLKNGYHTIEHILGGNASGGWHHFPSKSVDIDFTRKAITKVGNNGVYEAPISFTKNGQLVEKTNTFFPDSWSKTKVLDSIDEAFGNARFVPTNTRLNNTYIGKSNGIDIVIFKDSNGDIISAFPATKTVNKFTNVIIKYNGF